MTHFWTQKYHHFSLQKWLIFEPKNVIIFHFKNDSFLNPKLRSFLTSKMVDFSTQKYHHFSLKKWAIFQCKNIIIFYQKKMKKVVTFLSNFQFIVTFKRSLSLHLTSFIVTFWCIKLTLSLPLNKIFFWLKFRPNFYLS